MNKQKQRAGDMGYDMGYDMGWGNYFDIEECQPLHGDKIIYLDRVTRETTITRATYLQNNKNSTVSIYKNVRREKEETVIYKTNVQETKPKNETKQEQEPHDPKMYTQKGPNNEILQDPVLIKVAFCVFMVVCVAMA
jgi:hypothetical protein